MSGKVTRWSQSALCATAVCSESVYSWFDDLQVAITLTCLRGNTVSPGVGGSLWHWWNMLHWWKLSKSSQLALCITVACSDSGLIHGKGPVH